MRQGRASWSPHFENERSRNCPWQPAGWTSSTQYLSPGPDSEHVCLPHATCLKGQSSLYPPHSPCGVSPCVTVPDSHLQMSDHGAYSQLSERLCTYTANVKDSAQDRITERKGDRKPIILGGRKGLPSPWASRHLVTFPSLLPPSEKAAQPPHYPHLPPLPNILVSVLSFLLII